MKFKKLSLRVRIFFAMILLVLIASVLIAAVTIYQYKEEATDYHNERLERKESAIRDHLRSVIRRTTWPVETEKVPLIFKDELGVVADIHSLQINLYDMDGEMLISSKASLKMDTINKCIPAEVLNNLSYSASHRVVTKTDIGNEATFLSSYTYLLDNKFKPLAILNIPYLEKDDFMDEELEEFLNRLMYAYIFMILVAVLLAFLLSKFITKTLKTISDKINSTRLEKKNQKIEIDSSSEEIATLVNSYNSMIDELEDSAVKLARSEREQAWREMAKQVAHEIKNPLTPMRLSVQSFQRKFDPNDAQIHHKVDEYSKTLIQQIDTMSSIASAFSNFAKMPAQQKEALNVVSTVKLALDIFSEDYIQFKAEEDEIMANFDRTQLVRVVTNLVKNGIQAIPSDSENPEIIVEVSSEGENVEIKVRDNGVGISEENRSKVFEPKFTTKTSGMGLGLAMVRNIVETYGGSITFTSEKGKGTTFLVTFPKN